MIQDVVKNKIQILIHSIVYVIGIRELEYPFMSWQRKIISLSIIT